MNRTRNYRNLGLLAALGGALLLSFSQFAASAQVDKVVGANECAECHKKETNAWKQTHHSLTFKALPKSKEAKEIASKMGVKRLKADSLCLGCHFTVKVVKSKNKAVSGISCESCHGGGKDYLKSHSGFSGKKEGQESKAQIATRWKASEDAGLIRPKALYSLTKNCFSCHLVPEEKLVNIGGHTAGSKFELVSWTQGEIRHNLWYNKGSSNPQASIERRRMMFVVGKIVELESAIIGVGKATVKKDYALKMAKRASKARKVISALAKKLPDAPELAEILKAAKSAKLKLNNGEKLNAAAAKISILGLKFVAKYDGSTFAKIDKFIPKPKKYKGTVSK